MAGITPVIETFAAAGTELSIFDHADQHQRGVETRIVGSLVHLQCNSQYGRCGSKVIQFERSLGVSQAGVQTDIPVFHGDFALLQKADGIQHLGKEQAVYPEAGNIGRQERGFFHFE